MKPGDTVRYLNATGGGKITRIEDKIAYVEEDGFESPVLIKELVVVMPAGHQTSSGARLMFDQEAYDSGRKNQQPAPAKEKKSADREPSVHRSASPVTDGRFCLSLLFEPSNIKKLSASRFTALLLNDSNYSVAFAVAARRETEKSWRLIYRDVIRPDEIMDLAEFGHEDLPDIEYISVQAFAFAEGADFALCNPLSITRRIDITKFHKLHCFREVAGMDTPMLEFPLIKDAEPDLSLLQRSAQQRQDGRESGDISAALSRLKASTGKPDMKGKKAQGKSATAKNGAKGSHAPAEPVEVDLHIHELTDTLAGLQPADMLEMQLREVRNTMEANRKRIGQKIIFIHGKGEGVLRNALYKLIKKEYPSAELQDASFREYGFGATQVTIHQP